METPRRRLPLTRAQAREVACPTCTAKPRQPCIGKGGKPRLSNHAERYVRRASKDDVSAEDRARVMEWFDGIHPTAHGPPAQGRVGLRKNLYNVAAAESQWRLENADTLEVRQLAPEEVAARPQRLPPMNRQTIVERTWCETCGRGPGEMCVRSDQRTGAPVTRKRIHHARLMAGQLLWKGG